MLRTEDLAGRLLAWYDPDARGIPWRGTSDPYAILVAEFMLQQTRMETVLAAFDGFLSRFPTLKALADASEQDVLHAWSGLGYYRRARALHATARQIQAEHGGRVPKDPKALRALPGIGRYTAGAVASIAFGVAEPAVDGNVTRVLGRVLGETGASSRTQRRIHDAAHGLVAHGRPGDMNQALMDLGNLVCTPRAPRCAECPFNTACVALASGQTEAIVRRPTRAKPVEDLVAVLAWRGDRILVEPVEGRGVLDGLWGPPLRQRAPARARALPALTHTFSHKRWRVTPHVTTRAPGSGRRARWVTMEEWAQLPTSSLGRKLVEAAFAHRA